jgi:hypothetical protein
MDLNRRQFVRCGDELRREGLEEEADLFSLSKPEVQLHDLGDYRCLDCPHCPLLKCWESNADSGLS